MEDAADAEVIEDNNNSESEDDDEDDADDGFINDDESGDEEDGIARSSSSSPAKDFLSKYIVKKDFKLTPVIIGPIWQSSSADIPVEGFAQRSIRLFNGQTTFSGSHASLTSCQTHITASILSRSFPSILLRKVLS